MAVMIVVVVVRFVTGTVVVEQVVVGYVHFVLGAGKFAVVVQVVVGNGLELFATALVVTLETFVWHLEIPALALDLDTCSTLTQLLDDTWQCAGCLGTAAHRQLHRFPQPIN